MDSAKTDYLKVIDSFIHYVEEADDSFACDDSVKEFVEKLKAYKRLKEKGILFVRCHSCQSRPYIRITDKDDRTMFDDDINNDIDLLLGGRDD